MIHICSSFNFFAFCDEAVFLFSISDLLSLDLWRTGGLNDASFQTFVETCSQLEELDIGWW